MKNTVHSKHVKEVLVLNVVHFLNNIVLHLEYSTAAFDNLVCACFDYTFLLNIGKSKRSLKKDGLPIKLTGSPLQCGLEPFLHVWYGIKNL